MSDKSKNKDDIYDQLNTGRPRNMDPISDEKPSAEQDRAVQGLVKNNPRNTIHSDAERDNRQHVGHLKSALLLAATAGTIKNAHANYVYSKSAKYLQKKEKEAAEMQSSNGSGSIGSIYRNIKMEEARKKMEKIQKKYPNLVKSQSFGFRDAFKMIAGGVSNAMRTKMMQGITANPNSNARALAAVEAAGMVPGAGPYADDDQQMAF